MVDKLTLFDKFKRNYLGASGYSEPYFEYWNRTARPTFSFLRDLTQKWFDDYDADNEKRLRLLKEFRSNNNKVHLNALFELYLYTLFRSLNFDVEVEPTWGNKKPDFLITDPAGQTILV